MEGFGKALTRLISGVALAAALGAVSGPALADDAEEGRDLYISTCTKCHGLVTEDALSWTPQNLTVQTVTMPLGPPLSTVYGREAGIMPDYPYSRSFKKAIQNPWIWDEDSLDGWLTYTQNFIRGSTMFLKVEEPTRGKIIAYLKKYARYKPE